MKKPVWIAALGAAVLLLLQGQTSSILDLGKISGGNAPRIAIPDFRGTGEAQNFMGAFNETLRGDIQSSGLFEVVSKSFYPAFIPQQPSDFTTPPPVPQQPPRGRKQAISVPQNGGGRWLADWAGPPAQVKYLAFGYTAVQNGVLVLRGNLYDVGVAPPANPSVIGKNYLGTVDEAGARKIAHEFAADIIALFGGQTLFGTHIYFVSNRTGHKEIWVMDADGKNQRQITRFNALTIQPAVSPDGSKIAFTSFARGNPGIFVFSVDPVRDLRFYNQKASVNSSPSFTADGKQILYSSSAPGDTCCRIFMANLDGSGFRPITSLRSIDTEPKVNPKTGNEVVFVSGRSGPQQIYRMSIEGSDMDRLTDGTGEASNPAWHPNGQIMAYSWTRGYAAGAWNLFVMDVASHRYVQLTHGEGRNENPSWGPDGRHLAFASTRSGRSQIYTMLADGTQVQMLTNQGQNETPVWGK